MADEVERLLGESLGRLGLRLAVAESCTGGLIAHRVTNIPGSSAYFVGGVIAYANEAKVQLLDVKEKTLEVHGAVSERTVQEMARGVRIALQADIGLSVSGIAGPGGGTPEKPVGLVWIGLSTRQGEQARRYVFPGDRLSVKEQASQEALQWLVAYLDGLAPGDTLRTAGERERHAPSGTGH